MAATASTKRAIRLSDLPQAVRGRLPGEARTEQGFDVFVQSLDRQTDDRERAGEYEHLVYYLLQSRRFTSEAAIEPALSAYQVVQGMSAEERARFLDESEAYFPARDRIPAPVLRRAADFVRGLAADPSDTRRVRLERLLATAKPSIEPPLERLLSEYARVMRFLYRKEFLSPDLAAPQQLEAYLASLYRRRGHSTDTQVEANFAVHTALSVIRARGERELDRVLVIGPGLDFAPRTDLVDLFEPQSYQPFAVADALLSLQLSDRRRLRVHCLDINARVLEYLAGLSHERPTPLRLLSGVPVREDRPFTPEYRGYFESLGRRLGAEAALALPPGFSAHLGKAVQVDPDIAARITADRLNVVTKRYDPPRPYDLVVVTNVLSYYRPAEQVLALANIDSMLREGGYLIHNEPQSDLIAAAQGLGLPMTDARTVLIAAHPQSPLFDRVVIHRKKCRQEDP